MTGFWIFMTLTNMIFPSTMIGLGHRFYKNPPKKINSIYGYRTRRSMMNKDTWDFAHHYSGKLWKNVGLILIPFNIVFMLLCFGKDADSVSLFGIILLSIQVVIMIICIFPVETALKKTFDENGQRK